MQPTLDCVYLAFCTQSADNPSAKSGRLLLDKFLDLLIYIH